MSDEFDAEAFLEWLDEQDGAITISQMEDWPCFPWGELGCVTGVFHDGERAYYKRDLRRVAEGRRIID